MNGSTMNKKVGIERCPAYDMEEVYKALKRAVELSGPPDLAGKTVLLKPNLLFDTPPDKAVTTHPVFVEASIKLVREMGAKHVLVGDSPGFQPPGFMGKASGLWEVVKKTGVEWVDFSKEKIEITFPEGKVMKKFSVTKAVLDADIIITLPKLKTHQLMYFTGALKNNFGLIPSLVKSTLHVRFSGRESFASMLVDLNMALNGGGYAFMDAITGMEGPGPSGGTPRQVGLVLASSNLLAMDVAASSLIAYRPEDIPVNREALGRGFWLSNFNEIEYPGLSPEDLRIPDYIKIQQKRASSQLLDFILPAPLRRLRNSRAPGPVINHDICVRCGDCSRICASEAISGSGAEKRLLIDYRRCIRCFCCHEICPKKAIDIIKRPQNREN